MNTRASLYRTVIALMLFAALIIPQTTPVQSAPLDVKKTVKLKPTETIIVRCATRLVLKKSSSKTNWNFLCNPGKGFMPPRVGKKIVNLRPGDTVVISCSTKLTWKFNFWSGWFFLCNAVPVTATPNPTKTVTATQVPPTSTATNTLEADNTSTPTGTDAAAPTETYTSTSAVTEAAETTEAGTSTPTGTLGPVDTATATSTATLTAMPTATLSPTATSTKTSGGPIQPFKDAPACPTHDSFQWHGIWDYQRGCHYDHTHGDDPSLADKYFGPLGKYWNGTTISYPFNSGASENTLKHAGYKISVRMPGYHPWPACGQFDNTDITGDHSDNCVIASRTEYHTVGGLMDLVGRYHSYWMEIYVCKPPYRQPQDCGIMRTGGLLDYGQLQAPHYNARVVRPGGTIDFGNGITMTYNADDADLPSHSGEPYVFSYPYTSDYINLYRNNSPHGRGAGTAPGSYQITIDQWSSNDFDCEPRPAGDPCHNQYTHVMFQVGDAFNLVDTQNLNTVRWICYGQPGCEYDGSMIGMNEIAIRVLQSWQSSGNGFVTFNGYSDKWGNPRFDNTCTSVSTDCVPFILEHAPVGVAGSKSNGGCLCDVWEYDVYFNNRPSGWIKFPN